MGAPTRRAALAGLALAAAGAPPAAPANDGPDPHPAWAAKAAALRDRIDAAPDDAGDELLDTAFGRLCALRDRIAATPARTAAGAAEQLRLALGHHDAHATLDDCELLALRNALATLDALAGRA